MLEHEAPLSPKDAVEELREITESSEVSYPDGTTTTYRYSDDSDDLPDNEQLIFRDREDMNLDRRTIRSVNIINNDPPIISIQRTVPLEQHGSSSEILILRENLDKYSVKIQSHSPVLPLVEFTANYPDSGIVSNFRVEVSRVLRDQRKEFINQISERVNSIDPQTYQVKDLYPSTPELIASTVSHFQSSPEILAHVVDTEMGEKSDKELPEFTEKQETLINFFSKHMLRASLAHTPDTLSFSEEQKDQLITLLQKPFEKRLKEIVKPKQLAVLEDRNALLNMLIADSKGESKNLEFEKLVSAFGDALDTTFWIIDRRINRYLNHDSRSHFEFSKKDGDTYSTVVVTAEDRQTREDLRVGGDLSEGIYRYSLERDNESLILRASNRINLDESHVIVFPENLGDTRELNSLLRTSDHAQWNEVFDRLKFGYRTESF